MPDEERKLTWIFIVTLLCGAPEGFMKAFKGLHKTFWGTTKKSKKKNLTKLLFQYNFQKCMER